MPQPTRAQIKRFCEIDGWEKLKGAAGREGDHTRYKKVLTDGTVLRTRVSHGRGAIESRATWHDIWKKQLGLESEQQFWDALKAKQPVARPGAHPVEEEAGEDLLPAWQARALLRELRLSPSEIAELGRDEADRLINEHRSKPRPPDKPR